MSKFLLICSCIFCKRQVTSQSLKAHYHAHFLEMPTCKLCGEKCPNKNNTFCSIKCSTFFNHRKGTYKGKTFGPKKGTPGKKLPPYTKIGFCKICKKAFLKKGYKATTCSKKCNKTLLSESMRQSILSSGRNQNKNRGRGKESFLEKSFRQYLEKNFPEVIFEQEKHFRRKDLNKSYFVDFFFPEINLAIELDGTQHLDPVAKEYDLERDEYISSSYGINILRISHKEYVSKSRIEEVSSLLNALT